jgi:hypothetical protein
MGSCSICTRWEGDGSSLDAQACWFEVECWSSAGDISSSEGEVWSSEVQVWSVEVQIWSSQGDRSYSKVGVLSLEGGP